MKKHLILRYAFVVSLPSILGFLLSCSNGSQPIKPTPLEHTANHQVELQGFAWNQFQLFLTGGERGDGTYDRAWGPWSQWITRSDLKPHQLSSAETAAASLNQNDFKQLILSGLTASILENSAPDHKLTPTQCNPKVPAPCSTVLYNAKAQSHIDSAHLLDRSAVQGFPKGVNGGVDAFPDDTIIVKTAWKVVEPITTHPELGNLVFSNVNFPGIQHFYLILDADRPCADVLTVPSVTDPHGGRIKQLSIQCFVNVPIKTKADAEAVTQGVSSVKQGDYVVLLGLNVARKQHGRWIWSTIWWSPEKNAQPEYDRKPKELQPAQWSFYRANAVDSVFDRDNPGKRLYCYNPYLEQSVVNETASNCVICHRLAEYPFPSSALALGSPGIDQSVNVPDDYYAGAVETDSLWTIADILEDGSTTSPRPSSGSAHKRGLPR